MQHRIKLSLLAISLLNAQPALSMETSEDPRNLEQEVEQTKSLAEAKRLAIVANVQNLEALEGNPTLMNDRSASVYAHLRSATDGQTKKIGCCICLVSCLACCCLPCAACRK